MVKLVPSTSVNKKVVKSAAAPGRFNLCALILKTLATSKDLGKRMDFEMLRGSVVAKLDQPPPRSFGASFAFQVEWLRKEGSIRVLSDGTFKIGYVRNAKADAKAKKGKMVKAIKSPVHQVKKTKAPALEKPAAKAQVVKAASAKPEGVLKRKKAAPPPKVKTHRSRKPS